MAFKINPSLCAGCGACAYECLFEVPQPTSDSKEAYIIDPEKCRSCGQCKSVCPNEAIYAEPGTKMIKSIKINQEKCIGCSLCARKCVAGAAYGEVKKPFAIDESKCIKCGLCAEKCPKDAVEVEYYDYEEEISEGGNMLATIGCRGFQAGMKVANYFLGYRMPEYIEGAGSVQKLPEMLKSKGVKRVLFITDGGLMSLGLPKKLLKALKESGLKVAVYADVEPNPTSDNVEAGFAIWKKYKCEAIIAMGGGSPMDCAKAIAAKAAHPKKSVKQLQGVLKVHRRVPLIFAVPTTAGTGSETTVAAVITESSSHHKASINDPCILPRYAVLDPELTVGLPPFITATTGMDALCHAVEAYTNHTYNTKLENDLAKQAVRLIYDNLLTAYQDGSNLEARQNMQKAAFFAGRSFTRGCVGYVHAVGHTLGGLYKVPHGLAMSIILPHVMKQFGPAVYRRLAELADVCGMEGKNKKEKAEKFIAWIEDMKAQMNIPVKTDAIKDEDVEQIIKWAMAEANPLYPVPVVWGHDDFIKLMAAIRE